MPVKRSDQHSRLAFSAILALLAMVLAPAAARADPYTVTLQQIGSNVVATGSGILDLTGLTYSTSTYLGAFSMSPTSANFASGPRYVQIAEYKSTRRLTGPTSFGSGIADAPSVFPNSTSDYVGMYSGGEIDLSVNGLPTTNTHLTEALSSSNTYTNTNFTGLGVNPGTYEWTWGSGPNQSFTLDIGAAAVPEPASAVLLGVDLLVFLAFGLVRRKVLCIRSAGEAGPTI